MSFKSLLKNLNLINIILTTGLVVFIVKFVVPSYKARPITLPTTVEKGVQEGVSVEGPPKREYPQPADYAIIAEDNLFHPDRRLVVSKGSDQPLHKPEFVLYGTLLAGNVKVAYMEDINSPYTTQGRGRRQQAIHIGEELSGYILSEIYSDMVVMTKGDERIEVNLLDQAHKREGRHKKAVTQQKASPKKKQKRPVSPPPIKNPENLFISRQGKLEGHIDRDTLFGGFIRRGDR